jgi:hypothetical protein
MRLEQSLNSELIFGQVSSFRGPPPGYAVMREFFQYQVPAFSNLAAAGGTLTQNLLIQADSDFEWSEGTYEFDLASAAIALSTQQVPNMTILMVDSGSGRQLSNAAVPVINLFGPLVMPHRLPITKVFKANSNIAITAVNFDAAVATGNLRLTLTGWKIYYYQTGGRDFPEQVPQS